MPDAARLDDVRTTLSGVPCLQGVRLALEAGRMHALVGPGGSGKTLILKTIATLLPPDSGTVSLFGEPVPFGDEDRLRPIRSRIGVQFQNLALFDFLTVGDNVALPLEEVSPPLSPEERDRRVAASLQAVRLPGGVADLPIQALSGGMQRRVAVARAAVARPDLLLFDDPAGGLDPVTTSRIFDLISREQRQTGATVVITSHDIPRLARCCSRFHLADAGTILFSGTLEDARSHPDPRVRDFFQEVQDAAR